LAKFEKRLSVLYEQLSKCKSSSYKNTFTTTALLKKNRALRFKVWVAGLHSGAANSDKKLRSSCT
jgi:hypothetical protein